MTVPSEGDRLKRRLPVITWIIPLAVGVVVGGAALWWTRRGSSSTANSDLGLALLGSGLALLAGVVVAYAVFVAERKFDAALQASDAANRRTAVQLALASTPSLEGIDLGGLDMSRLGFHGKNLSRARFPKATLVDADLSSAVLVEANLNKADLSNADLRKANFQQASLNDATLAGADVAGADFSGAQLFGAVFKETTRWRSDLNARVVVPDAKNLDEATFHGAYYTQHTRWPQGFDPDEAGAIYGMDES